MIKRTRDEWKMLVEQWRASGRSMTAWCREQQIHKNTFIYWTKISAPPKKVDMVRDDFTELKNEKHASTAGVLIEWRGCKIHLDHAIAPLILEKCLHVIGRHRC
jgi:hypothetical protein